MKLKKLKVLAFCAAARFTNVAMSECVNGVWDGPWVGPSVTRKGSQRSALETCLQQPSIDPVPYSYSGPACLGWNDARPDFCGIDQ